MGITTILNHEYTVPFVIFNYCTPLLVSTTHRRGIAAMIIISDIIDSFTAITATSTDYIVACDVVMTSLWVGVGSRATNPGCSIRGNDACFSGSGHRISQYDFVYDDRHRRVIDHVLRFETLQEDFDALVKEYDLPLELTTLAYRKSAGKELGVHNVTAENLLLIENLCWDDFRAFGYEGLSLRPPPNDTSLPA
jgi:hypothetical protein